MCKQPGSREPGGGSGGAGGGAAGPAARFAGVRRPLLALAGDGFPATGEGAKTPVFWFASPSGLRGVGPALFICGYARSAQEDFERICNLTQTLKSVATTQGMLKLAITILCHE